MSFFALGVEDGQPQLIQWAIQQGGAFVVILVILFFYRRDWKTAVEFWHAQHEMAVELVKESTKAQASTTSALVENTTVMHGLKRSMEAIYLHRRDSDSP